MGMDWRQVGTHGLSDMWEELEALAILILIILFFVWLVWSMKEGKRQHERAMARAAQERALYNSPEVRALRAKRNPPPAQVTERAPTKG